MTYNTATKLNHMRKVLIYLSMAALAGIVLAVTIRAMGSLPTRQADCSAKNVVKKTDGTCECRQGYVWDDAKSQCVHGIVWCSANFAKRSAYNVASGECECRKGSKFDLKLKTCVDIKTQAADTSNGSGGAESF